MIAIALTSVAWWSAGTSCTPTALAAIIPGVRRRTIKRALARAVAHSGGSCPKRKFRKDYAPVDWKRAAGELGIDLVCLDHHNFLFTPRQERPTIEAWMGLAARDPNDVWMVVCDNDRGDGHVFAAQGEHLVDTWTDGRILEFTQTPTEFRDFRISYALLAMPELLPVQWTPA